MAAAFRLSDRQRERGVVIGGDDLPPGSPAFIRLLPRAGEPAIALYDGRRGRHRTAGGSLLAAPRALTARLPDPCRCCPSAEPVNQCGCASAQFVPIGRAAPSRLSVPAAAARTTNIAGALRLSVSEPQSRHSPLGGVWRIRQ
jgi:hypothetical protein